MITGACLVWAEEEPDVDVQLKLTEPECGYLPLHTQQVRQASPLMRVGGLSMILNLNPISERRLPTESCV